MHPILGRTQRLLVYLAVWFALGLVLALALARLGLGWPAASALLMPLLFVYSFVCLSAWYVCRATPLRTNALARAIFSAALAAAVSATLLVALARLWVAILRTGLTAFPWERVDQQLPFVFAVGVLLYLLAIAVHYVFIAFESAREAERHRLELEVLTREAELRALRAQVDPHFLYNSLNSISALTTTDPAGARRMCLLLGEFLRNTLEVSSQSKIPLQAELGLVDRFLAIEQVRFGARLRVERHVDPDAISCAVPPLILQPLVENAVTHGIASLLEGGLVRLDVARANGRVSITIENPQDASLGRVRSHGFGLDNVRDRLSTMFERAARLNVDSAGDRFRVELDIPWSPHE